MRSLFPFRTAAIPLFGCLALLLFHPGHARGDIYRFVTVDGVETFTDIPVDKQARVVIRESPRRRGRKGKKEKIHDVSLDEIMEKTVQASVNPRRKGAGATVEPRLPLPGNRITSPVGMRVDPIDGSLRHHNGIDIAAAEGTPVTAVAPGRVIYSGMRSGYGNTVVIRHGNGLVTLYAHNSRLLVSSDQVVDGSTVIALSGNTGRSTGPHLHFEAWQAGTNVTQAFMPDSSVRIAAIPGDTGTPVHREILADGSILLTNLPRGGR